MINLSNKVLPGLLMILSIPVAVNVAQHLDVFTNPQQVIERNYQIESTIPSYPEALVIPTLQENYPQIEVEKVPGRKEIQVPVEKPVDKTEKAPVDVPISYPKDPVNTKTCIISGCSGQICGEVSLMSTCEWRPEYACFKQAKCEIQPTGNCGWTYTPEYNACYIESTNVHD
jgi:hypothetical protein